MKKFLILLLLLSCAKEVDDLGFRVYTIPAGEHSSGSFINHPDNSKISFQFILDESAIYESEIPENQHDVNKIYGFSDFGLRHQKYSIRLGWSQYNLNLENEKMDKIKKSTKSKSKSKSKTTKTDFIF